jgi:hypothetical protein
MPSFLFKLGHMSNRWSKCEGFTQTTFLKWHPLCFTRYSLSQPHFWKSVRMTLTLPKWGLGSPRGLLKLQSWIAWVKTPCIWVFFISLESYESVDVENELAWAIWTSRAQVVCKRRAGSRESTRPKCVQGECNTPLESSQGKLQVCFRPRPDRRSEQRVMTS